MLTGRVTRLIPLSVKYFKEDKHFIDVGGSSLIAVQLKFGNHSQIRATTKIKNCKGLYFSRYAGKIGKRTAERQF